MVNRRDYQADVAAFLEKFGTLGLRQISVGKADAAVFLATGFGSGYSPWAPGTIGTIVAIPLAILITWGGTAFHVLVTLLLTIAAIPISTIAEKELRTRDPKSIVIDEIVGYLWAVAFIPFSIGWWLMAFLLFRFFDIAKPGLIDRAQNLPSGLGIVADDVLAGLLTALCLVIPIMLFA